MKTLAQQKDRDQLRTAMQAPITCPMYRVFYLKDGRERRSPWFASRKRAQRALEVMKARYGRAIIYVD